MYSDRLRLQGESQEIRPQRLRDQLRIPPINMDLVRSILTLPDNFCGTCTLREGIIITLIVLQTSCLVFIGIASMLLYWMPDKCARFWYEKWKGDFDPYVMDENKELINKLTPLWADVTYWLIVVHGVFFLTGLLVIYPLNVKNANPFWYVPWLLMSGFLVASVFMTGFSILVVNIILLTYRSLTVTWDIVPVILVFVVGYFWAYGFFISVAHYKRRCIVKYWRDSQMKLGNLNF